MLWRLLVITFFFQVYHIKVKAVEIVSRQDSVIVYPDSAKMKLDSLKYLELEKKLSRKSDFTKYLHNLIFRSLIPDARKKIQNLKVYRFSEGKFIRKIEITTLDPIGYSLEDTLEKPQGLFQRTADKIHIKTEPGIIKNLLLFKENDRYDSSAVNESVRLIRAQRYVQNVLLYTKPAKGDSVDVYIRVLDVWSTIPSLSISPSSFDARITDHNFAGFGSTFRSEVYSNRTANESYLQLGYYIPNIRRTFIQANFQYLFSSYGDLLVSDEFTRPYYSTTTSKLPYLFPQNKGLIKGLEFVRPFYSPVAKWAGGIFLGQMITSQSYIPEDTARYLSALTNISDIWGARSWRLFRDFPGDYTTSFVLSGRYLRIRVKERTLEAEQANIFNSEDMVFAGIGITSRKYLQDKYIFNYGKTEDVPIGRSANLTIGYDFQQKSKFYLGLKASWGQYSPIGYFSPELEYGTFIGSSGSEQAVISGRVNYFTNLLSSGKWRIRQFIRPALVIGINRRPEENLSLSDAIRGFQGQVYPAKNMMVLTLQTQSYAPWRVYGFHFGPYFFCSLAMLGDASGFLDTPVYALAGIGILVKNDYLTFNNFQLSLSFYPSMPGIGNNIFKFNAYSTTDYGFTDFEIKKPAIANYR